MLHLSERDDGNIDDGVGSRLDTEVVGERLRVTDPYTVSKKIEAMFKRFALIYL